MWTLRSLAARLKVQHSKVQRGVDRLAVAGIYDPDRHRVIEGAAEEFVLHGLRYLHPIKEGAVVRGVPTARGAAPLREELAGEPVEAPPVWPSARGRVRGPAIEPLDPVVTQLVDSWPHVAELVDGLRIGDARTRRSAAEHLRQHLAAAR